MKIIFLVYDKILYSSFLYYQYLYFIAIYVKEQAPVDQN